jgi:hypothetical protein
VKRLKKEIELLKKEIELLKKENEQLKAGKGPAAWANDPFAKGSIWVGKRDLGGKDTDGQKWDLTITERKQDGSFKGEMRLFGPKGNPASYPAEGFAPAGSDGDVSFTAAKGNFKQVFKGKLKNGQVGLSFSGTSPTGDRVKGTAFLNPN